MAVSLSVIMPVYNSQDLKKNIEETLIRLNTLKIGYELIVVNDGSTNNSFNSLKYKNPLVKVVGYKINKGKGNAIKYGFGFVSGDYVAFVDAGRDIDPFQLKKFLQIMKEKNADIVIGSKRHKKSDVYYPLARKIMSRTYQILNKFLFNLNVKDTQVGLKLFRRQILDKVMKKIAVKRFAFDLELLVIANKHNAKIIESPVKIRYKFGSTINIFSVFWILWDTAAIFYREKILRYYG